jgi:hypothetical protein
MYLCIHLYSVHCWERCHCHPCDIFHELLVMHPLAEIWINYRYTMSMPFAFANPGSSYTHKGCRVNMTKSQLPKSWLIISKIITSRPSHMKTLFEWWLETAREVKTNVGWPSKHWQAGVVIMCQANWLSDNVCASLFLVYKRSLLPRNTGAWWDTSPENIDSGFDTTSHLPIDGICKTTTCNVLNSGKSFK